MQTAQKLPGPARSLTVNTMVSEVSLGGFLMSRLEWVQLDDHSKRHLLGAVIETANRRDNEFYESYELTLDPDEPLSY